MKYKTMDEMFQHVSDLVSGKIPNGKFQIARIYGAYERECEEIEKEKKVEREIGERRKCYEIHRISDNMYIVEYKEDIFNNGIKSWFSPFHGTRLDNTVYPSFDEALIALLCMKNNCCDAVPYVCKLLDIGKNKESTTED